MGNTVPKTKVLHMVEVSAGDAASLYDSIVGVIKRRGLPTTMLASFASDGAAVMTGKLSLLHWSFILLNDGEILIFNLYCQVKSLEWGRDSRTHSLV